MSCDPFPDSLSPEELHGTFSCWDLKRMDLYSRNMADHHLITDLLPKCRRKEGGRGGGRGLESGMHWREGGGVEEGSE